MTNVIASIATFPRLILGTVFSFFGAVTGATPELQRTPFLQQLVWAASIFAAIATGTLALVRAYSEVKAARKRRLDLD